MNANPLGTQIDRLVMNRINAIAVLSVMTAMLGDGMAQNEQPRRLIRAGRADTLLKPLIDELAQKRRPADVLEIKWRSEWDDVRRDLKLFVLEFRDRVVKVTVDGKQTHRFSDTDAPDVSFARGTKKGTRQDKEHPRRLADLKAKVLGGCTTDSSRRTKRFVISLTFVFREDRGLDVGNDVRGLKYEEQLVVDLYANALDDSKETQR